MCVCVSCTVRMSVGESGRGMRCMVDARERCDGVMIRDTCASRCVRIPIVDMDWFLYSVCDTHEQNILSLPFTAQLKISRYRSRRCSLASYIHDLK